MKKKFVKRVYISNEIYKLLSKNYYKKFFLNEKLKNYFYKLILKLKKTLDGDNETKALIISLCPKHIKRNKISPMTISSLTIYISNIIGKPLIQNSEKEKYIKVYDRSRKLSMLKVQDIIKQERRQHPY